MAVVGAGITLDFASGFTAQLLTLTEPDEGIEAIDITSADDATKQYIQGSIVNPGRIEGSMNFDPDAVPPFTTAPQVSTITYPNGATKAAIGFLTMFNTQMSDIEDRMTADFVLQLSGPVARTPAP